MKAGKLFPILIVVFCALSSIHSYAQDSTSVQKQTLNYFKIEVGIVIDCPVLTMRIKEKLAAVQGIKDYSKNRDKQNITFNIPEGVVTKEQVISIAVSSGFPAHLVNVLMDNKPFSN